MKNAKPRERRKATRADSDANTSSSSKSPEQSQSDSADEGRAARSRQFDVVLAMLKDCRADIDRYFAWNLSVVVITIGWLMTSESARVRLAKTEVRIAATMFASLSFVMLWTWIIFRWRQNVRIGRLLDGFNQMDARCYFYNRLDGKDLAGYLSFGTLVFGFLLFLIIRG